MICIVIIPVLYVMSMLLPTEYKSSGVWKENIFYFFLGLGVFLALGPILAQCMDYPVGATGQVEANVGPPSQATASTPEAIRTTAAASTPEARGAIATGRTSAAAMASGQVSAGSGQTIGYVPRSASSGQTIDYVLLSESSQVSAGSGQTMNFVPLLESPQVSAEPL